MGSSCIGVLKVSFAFPPPPPLQLIHQNRQAILNQFAANSPVGINMRAGMQQQITPQVRGMRHGPPAGQNGGLIPTPSLLAQPGSLLSVLNGREKFSLVQRGGCKMSC